jgi:NitT/TauT family transport system permease protein
MTPSTYGSWVRVVAPIVVGILLIAVWVLAVDVLKIAPRMVPSPAAIGSELALRIGIIGDDMLITGTNALVGLLVGALLGIVLAGFAAAARPIDGMLAPLVAALAVVPIVALTPILNTMFGASSQFGRQAVAAIAAFIPVFINVLRGLRQTRPVHRDLLRASGATGWQTFAKLTLPTALPYLVTGVRIAASLAVMSPSTSAAPPTASAPRSPPTRSPAGRPSPGPTSPARSRSACCSSSSRRCSSGS